MNKQTKPLPLKTDCAINCTMSIDKATISVPIMGKDVEDVVEIGKTLTQKGGFDYKNTKNNFKLPHNHYFYFSNIASACVYLDAKDKSFGDKIGLSINPNLAGREGTATAINFFIKYFCNDDKDWFFNIARVGRIDCAVDIFDIGIEDAIFVVGENDVKYSDRYGRDGRKQSEIVTTYKANRTIIYDKRAKTIEDNENNDDFDPSTLPDNWTRIEKNLKNCGDFCNLVEKKNPFADFVVARRECPEGINPTVWNLVNAAINATTYEHVLDLIEHPKTKGKVIMGLNAQPYEGWDTEFLWMHWPIALKESGLFDPFGKLGGNQEHIPDQWGM